MSLRIAFVGFRHGHIFSLYKLAQDREDVEIVAACEEDEDTRAGLEKQGVTITHRSYAAMLADVKCDVIACGDYFAARGGRLIAALEAVRHVLADKPLCTQLDELNRIESLAHAKGLRVGCMLDLPDGAPWQTLRRIIHEGTLGTVHTIGFSGQHPLKCGSRPSWYFEEGKHGGTLNDIAVHGIDIIPWLTRRTLTEVTAARVWNTGRTPHRCFQDGAVVMLRLDNEGAVLGDVSYLAPDSHGYSMPSYWRFCVTGTEGYAETSCTVQSVTIYRDGEEAARQTPFDAARPGGYFEDFLRDLAGRPDPDGLNTARVLRSTRIALLAQAAADHGRFPCRLRLPT